MLTAIEKTADGFGLFDTEDRLLFCNSAFAALFDYTLNQAQGKRFDELIRHVHQTRKGLNVETHDVEAWLVQAKHNRRSSQYRSFEVDDCEGRWFLLTEQQIHDGYLFIFFTEVTQQKHTEKQLHQLSSELKALAETDSLTGLSNRRHFLQQANNELSRNQRLHRTMALLVLDVDHFKEINDRFGHQIGDQALQAIAQSIQRIMRPYDVFGRIGGEEFAVLLPEASCQQTLEIAERLRSEVESIDGDQLGIGLRLTLSIGVTCSPTPTLDTSLDQLMAKADRALYGAKAAGRNCVVCATES